MSCATQVPSLWRPGAPCKSPCGKQGVRPNEETAKGWTGPTDPCPKEIVTSVVTKRTAEEGSSKKEEDLAASLAESPKPQRQKKRRTDLPSNTQGTTDEAMELEGSAECTQ